MAKYSKNKLQYTPKRFIHTQTRKAVSATAGVQAIIESPVGAFKVEKLDKWWFFNPKNQNNYSSVINNGYIFEIKEPRLLNRLRNTGIFKNLQRIIRVPPNSQNEDNRLFPSKENQVGRVEYFPTWMFCETCERLKSIKEWWNGWVDVLKNDESINDNDRIKRLFVYDTKSSGRPNCYCCYKDAIEEKRKGKIKRKYHKLEQVRFIFVSSDGDIKDIDWAKWITAQMVNKTDLDESTDNLQGRYLLGENNCCDTPSLKYLRSTKLSDLVGITIECETCKKKRTLAGFFNLRKKKGIITDNKNNTYLIYYKPLIRTSNSVYYPIIMSSLYIPQPLINLSFDQKSTIRVLDTAGNKPEDIVKVTKISLSDVKQVLGEGNYLTEIEYRRNEYEYFLNKNSHEIYDKDLVFEDVQMNDSFRKFGFDNMTKICRLKLTSVQIGYTRLSPLDKDVFSQNEDKMIRFDNKEIPLKPGFTVSTPNATDFLMGIENFGEGIFIKWDDTILKSYIEESMRNKEYKKRIDSLLIRIKENEMTKKDKFIDTFHLAKFLLIHSFSHLIIKELEFLCGYPSTSVNERIYCDQDKMNGLLIYTIAGSEGSFGGLIKQTENNNFTKILSSALLRAKDCTSDPICSYSDGQGVGGLNYAACYSCLLISETSCEEFNSFLDRRILVDEQFGFFKNNTY